MTIPLFAKVIWAFLRGIPWQVWAAAALLGTGLYLRAHWIAVGEGRVQVQWDASEAAHAVKAAQALAAARAIEQRHAAELAGVGAKLKQENDDALQERDRTIADLRRGALRVRDRFRCPTPRLPQAGGPASGGDGASEGGLSDTDAAFLVRFASDADRVVHQLAACQAVVRSDRQ